MGIMTWLFSSMSDMMYSLFQKYRARSATWDEIEFDLATIAHVWLVPGSVGWKHIWQFAWTEALEFWQIELAQSHPESPQFRPGTWLPSVNKSWARTWGGPWWPAPSGWRPSPGTGPRSRPAGRGTRTNIGPASQKYFVSN